MRAFVFTDKALASEARRFVWLEIDTEKAQNASVKQQLGVQGLPTFFVVDPATERVALRWLGSATVPQLKKILDDGRAAVAGGGKPAVARGKSGAADAALARADALYGEGKWADAAKAFQDALGRAPEGWPQYARTVESLLFALANGDENEAAAKLARDSFPKLRKTPSAANLAGTGLDCALALPAENPVRQALVTALEADARAVVDDTKIPIAADDRSGVYISLLSAREEANDSTGARDLAARWATFLEGEAARAKTPEARAVFDPHRVSAYLKLDQPERAIPMLETSERDLTEDYNPAARLAVVYKAMRRWDDALAASDRALAKVYGPRQLGLLQTRADIYVGKGDLAAARRTLEGALQTAESLPPGQRSEATVGSIKKKLDGLPKT